MKKRIEQANKQTNKGTWRENVLKEGKKAKKNNESERAKRVGEQEKEKSIGQEVIVD